MSKKEALATELLQELDQLTAEEVILAKEAWEAGTKKDISYPRVRNFIEEITRIALERKAVARTA